MATTTPLHPLDRWPVQLFDERFGFAWFIEPCTFINQSVGTHADVFAATWIQDRIDYLLAVRRHAVRDAGGMLVIHDWRTLQTYDTEARRIFMERMRIRKKGYLRAAVAILRDDASPMLRMAVQGANLLSAVSLGGQVKIEYDLAEILRTYRIAPPGADEAFPQAIA